MVRRRSDGNLEFLGRVDQMIKLRGFRVEPREIEVALCRHPVVSAAAVVMRPHPSGERRLVAYVAASRPEAGAEPGALPGAEDLRQFLASQLPQYMVPADFCFVDALPLTDNGKLDPRRLPDPRWRDDSEEPYVAPRTSTEATIASVWAEVLGLDRIGVTQDFFAIGGDSIRSIQIVTRLQAGRPPLRTQRPLPALDRRRPGAAGRPQPAARVARRGGGDSRTRRRARQPGGVRTALGQVEFDGDAEPTATSPGDGTTT